jgi:hypothetical protein
MTGAALRAAFRLWVRQPRELATANAVAFAAAFLPFVALPGLPEVWRRSAAAVLALWAWLVFGALCQACARAAEGASDLWAEVWSGFKRDLPERLGCFFGGALLAFWLGLVLDFYRAQALPLWAALPLFALLGAFGVWLAMALLLSLGVAANGGRSPLLVWKTAALLPLAYAPSALAALAIFALALGIPVFWTGVGHWAARLWLAPLLISPFFTLAYLAAYVSALVRAMLDHADGRPASGTGTWRELWTPWK